MTNGIEKIIQKFDSFDYYLNSKITRDIEENRKGQFVLRFKNTNGELLSNVHVKIRQKRHAFKFGCSLFIWINMRMRRDAHFTERSLRIFSIMPLSPFIGIRLSLTKENPDLKVILPLYHVALQSIRSCSSAKKTRFAQKGTVWFIIPSSPTGYPMTTRS